MSEAVVIERMTGAEAQARGCMPAIDAIFFGAAARTYPPGAERDAFRERWLGRFLDCPEDPLLIAFARHGDAAGHVAGYLVGTLENAAQSQRFSDMPHFRAQFAAQCTQYPAHLHINLAPEFRGRGIGSRLVHAFCDIVRGAGLPGVHVTTGRGMRNVGFYVGNGFREVGDWPREGGAMVFLGRSVCD